VGNRDHSIVGISGSSYNLGVVAEGGDYEEMDQPMGPRAAHADVKGSVRISVGVRVFRCKLCMCVDRVRTRYGPTWMSSVMMNQAGALRGRVTGSRE
jgi:hypothetical protein